MKDISDWDKFYQSCGYTYKRIQPMLAREEEKDTYIIISS